MILIVASTLDVAGINIAHQLIHHYGFEKAATPVLGGPTYVREVRGCEVNLTLINRDAVDTQFITDLVKPELLVFISRHSSARGVPTLSVHTPGNLGPEAKFGGLPGKVSVSPASAMRDVLVEMTRQREALNLPYEVCYECTHHGPSLDVPTFFAELGSTIEQWRDERAAEAVAHSVMAAIARRSHYPAVLGVGGPHYNLKFTRMALEMPVAFGHIVPKYMLPKVGPEVIRQCVERTLEPVEAAVLDWKGIPGACKGWVVDTLRQLGVPVRKV